MGGMARRIMDDAGYRDGPSCTVIPSIVNTIEKTTNMNTQHALIYSFVLGRIEQHGSLPARGGWAFFTPFMLLMFDLHTTHTFKGTDICLWVHRLCPCAYISVPCDTQHTRQAMANPTVLYENTCNTNATDTADRTDASIKRDLMKQRICVLCTGSYTDAESGGRWQCRRHPLVPIDGIYACCKKQTNRRTPHATYGCQRCDHFDNDADSRARTPVAFVLASHRTPRMIRDVIDTYELSGLGTVYSAKAADYI